MKLHHRYRCTEMHASICTVCSFRHPHESQKASPETRRDNQAMLLCSAFPSDYSPWATDSVSFNILPVFTVSLYDCGIVFIRNNDSSFSHSDAHFFFFLFYWHPWNFVSFVFKLYPELHHFSPFLLPPSWSKTTSCLNSSSSLPISFPPPLLPWSLSSMQNPE